MSAVNSLSLLRLRTAVVRASLFAHSHALSSTSARRFINTAGVAAPEVTAQTSAKPAARKKSSTSVVVPRDKSTISPIRAFFYGELTSFQKHCMPFPTVLDAEQRETLKQLVDPVERFFGSVDSARIDREEVISPEVMSQLCELGLFGLQIGEDLGGLGLSNTAFARVIECMTDPSIAVTLLAHQSIGLKGILMFGTEAQRQKYLPRLATGEHVAAFALTEPGTGSDAASIKLSATPTPDGKGYALNGQKMWISNGGIAQIYTVFARTPVPGGAPGETKVTAFIVDRDFGGLTPGPPEHKLGIRGSNTVVLNFENCIVPNENVLGAVGGGFKIAVSILNSGRFGMGAGSAGGIKMLVKAAGEYANQRVQFGRPISSFGLVQAKFAAMAADAYAIESMTYMTTSLVDKAKVPAESVSSSSSSAALVPMDCSLEAAACKVFASEAMFRAVNESIQVLGGMGFSAGGAYPFERGMRDSRILLIFEGTNEILRLFIALTALQGPGAELSAVARAAKSGNVLSLLRSGPAMVRALLAENLGLGVPSLSGVPPQLAEEAGDLGHAVTAFRGAVRSLLVAHGASILDPQHQMQLARVADCGIDLFAWSCVVARASAAVRDGVPHLAHELRLARLAVSAARNRIMKNCADIRAGEAANGDADTVAAAKEMLSEGRYLAEHPLRV